MNFKSLVIAVGVYFSVALFVNVNAAPPFDHDQFLQFPESNTADTVASANAYYQAVDPDNLRTTLDDWKTLNGFIEPLPNTTVGLAAIGITHALYRNATDLGFVRNIYIRVKANGDVVALLENYPGFERTTNFSFDEVADLCAVPFNSGAPVEQQCRSGGVDAFENRDLSGMLASVVMEYSAVKTGGPKFTQFYGYGNDGTRVAALDLTGRGKAEAFPGLCAVCHGGNPGAVDAAGKFVPHDLAYAGAVDGNFGAGFLPWDPDLYEYHDPSSAGVEVGSGTYSRANQEASFKELNRHVLTTNPTPATRELVEGWYGGVGLPGSFNSLFVPADWTYSATDTDFYKTVVGPYCRACHIQRAFPENTPNVNARTSQMDFNSVDDFEGLYKQIANTVYSRTTMPLALVTYNKFWNDSAAVSSFTNFVNFYSPSVLPTVDDGMGTQIPLLPGKPIAIPGSYSDQLPGGSLTLDGSRSLSADTFSWSVSPAGADLDDPSAAQPIFTASLAGTYTVTLTVTSTDGRPEASSDPVSVTIKVADTSFTRITFESSLKNSPTNAKCLRCHSSPDAAGFEDFNFHDEILKMTDLGRASYVQGNFTNRLLYKPAALFNDSAVRDGVHSGGKIIQQQDEYYSLLKNWLEDGECKNEFNCQRISVSNENTALEIDPLSPFMDKSLFVSAGSSPANGSLTLTSGQKLLYTPDTGFTGLDTYHYSLTNLQTGESRLIVEKIYIFPDYGNSTHNFNEYYSALFSDFVPAIGTGYEFEKVNTDGDSLPNYVDDFPNNPFISRDHDGDGLADEFNFNVSSVDAAASGITIDSDDDNDGVDDAADGKRLDGTEVIFVDSDRDGIENSKDPNPLDMLGTDFEDFESGGLGARPWVTSGDGTWTVVSPANTAYNPLTGNFVAKTPHIDNGESATLSVTLTFNTAGSVSFWYFSNHDDSLEFDMDGIFGGIYLEPFNEWTRYTITHSSGTHTFTWTYSKSGRGSGGLDTAWIDAIEFSGPRDRDNDGSSDILDNCFDIKNINQNDANFNGIGDACDTGDTDIDGIADNVEVTQGTDPNNSDTDGDGVNDGTDAFVLDPAASVDSDGDGYPDSLVFNVTSTSQPPLTVDLEPLTARAGLDIDGDGVGDNGIYNVAGGDNTTIFGDGNQAADTSLNSAGIALDAAGNLYIAAGSSSIRRVDANTGIITTVAGTTGGFSGDGGPATAAQLWGSAGIAFDASGNLFILDPINNNRIRRVDGATGIITTVAGNGVAGFSGDGGLATAAEISPAFESGIVLDAAGNFFFTDTGNQRVRKVDVSTGVITTVAGTGVIGFSGDGGLAIAAQLNTPQELAFDSLGHLYIGESSGVIRRVDIVTGIITTIAGTSGYAFGGDGGLAIAAEFSGPSGLDFDAADNLYITDQSNNRIRRIDKATGIITTIAGVGRFENTGDNGLASSANVWQPHDIEVDASGNLFVSTNGGVRKITLVNPVDAFPYNPAASVDTDGDGFPDSFNAGVTAQQIADSGLTIDAFPNEPAAAIDTDGDGLPDQFILHWLVLSGTVLTEDFDDDGDGASDVVEIVAGTDPLSDTSTPIISDGDGNGDGSVDTADLLLGMRILTGLYTPTPTELSHLDVAPLVGGTPSPDGQFTVGDYAVLTRKVLGLVNF